MSQDNKSAMVQGRIVFVIGEDLFKGGPALNYSNKTPKVNKMGQQFREYGFGLAVPKSEFAPEKIGPGLPGHLWQVMHEVAYQMFPNRQIPPSFKMKYKDGDTGTNQDGTPVNTREGYPGCLVLVLKSTFPPKFFRYDSALKQNVLINEGIKCGDYVNVQVSVGLNSGQNAGLYLNPMAVQFLGHGKEIINMPSGDSIFGNQAPSLPPGASATPQANPGFLVPSGQPMSAQGFPAAAPVGFQQPMQPQPAFAPQMAPVPAQAAQPHWGVVPQHLQPQPAGPAPVPSFPMPSR